MARRKSVTGDVSQLAQDLLYRELRRRWRMREPMDDRAMDAVTRLLVASGNLDARLAMPLKETAAHGIPDEVLDETIKRLRAEGAS